MVKGGNFFKQMASEIGHLLTGHSAIKTEEFSEHEKKKMKSHCNLSNPVHLACK